MSPTVATKSYEQQEVNWQQYHLCLAVAQDQILGGKHFLILGPETGRIWWLKKVQYLQKRCHCQWACLVGKKAQVDFSQSWQSVTTVRINPNLAWASGSYREWQVRTILGDCTSKAKGNYSSSTTVSSTCVDQ